MRGGGGEVYLFFCMRPAQQFVQTEKKASGQKVFIKDGTSVVSKGFCVVNKGGGETKNLMVFVVLVSSVVGITP